MIRSRVNWNLKNKRYALICQELFASFSLDKALPTPAALVNGAEWEEPTATKDWPGCDHLAQAWPSTVPFYLWVPIKSCLR